MTLPGFTYTLDDFTTTDVKRNNCAGCWFAEQANFTCWHEKNAAFVKAVFAENGGSCAHSIAILKNEV